MTLWLHMNKTSKKKWQLYTSHNQYQHWLVITKCHFLHFRFPFSTIKKKLVYTRDCGFIFFYKPVGCISCISINKNFSPCKSKKGLYKLPRKLFQSSQLLSEIKKKRFKFYKSLQQKIKVSISNSKENKKIF